VFRFKRDRKQPFPPKKFGSPPRQLSGLYKFSWMARKKEKLLTFGGLFPAGRNLRHLIYYSEQKSASTVSDPSEETQ
jgi:hypothetical protein